MRQKKLARQQDLRKSYDEAIGRLKSTSKSCSLTTRERDRLQQ